MGLQRPQRHEIARAALAARESTNLEQVVEKPVTEEPVQSVPEPVPEPVQAEPKKVGRPKKEKKQRSAKQLANDERQRQRFRDEHAARKKNLNNNSKASVEQVQEPVEEPVPEAVDEEVEEEVEEEELAESEPEVEEETVYIKRQPRTKAKRKRKYVIESSSSDDDDDDMDDSRYRRVMRRVPEPRFSNQDDPFTLTFA